MTRFEECLAALQGVARFERTHQIWDTHHDDQALSRSDFTCLQFKRWDGVISRHTTPEFANACRELGIPLVDLNDTEKIAGVPKLRPDNHGVGRIAAEHLIERGFRSFAFEGFSETWSQERREGFEEAVRRAGRTCVVRESPYPGDRSQLWDSDAIESIRGWLAELPRPCGVMGCADFRARQILAAARALGRRVPEELAVIGTNNDTIRCELSYPRLSSVEINAFRTGYRAAEVLAAMLHGQDVGDLDERIPPTGVITRQSTDIQSVGDASVARALTIIRERACSGLTADELSSAVHASRSQLEKKFRRFIGRSPQAEIRRVRLDKIRQLLTETDLPLKRIAEITGFGSIEYLSVFFKRAVGEPPGQFRANTSPKVMDMTRERPEDAAARGSTLAPHCTRAVG